MKSSNQSIIRESNFINVELVLFITKEDKYFVVYCPALELSSYGDTEEEALKLFEENLTIFIEETIRKGTLERLLLQYGWSLRKLPEPSYSPPSIDKFLSNWFSETTYKNIKTEIVRIPA